MKVLVCNDKYSDVVAKMAAFLPEHEISVCSPGAVKDNLAGVDVLVPSIAKITREIIEAGQFGFIQQMGVGLDSVDIPSAESAGVLVANIPGAESGNTDSVAEHAILLMLALSRQLYRAKEAIEKGVFAEPRGMSLLTKTVCIVGLGDIGKALAQRLKSFKCKLIAVRAHAELGADPELGIEHVYGVADLDQALAQSDYVVLCLPQQDNTKHMINKDRIQAMKAGSFLVNVARGGIVDTEALCDALQSGKIAGAGLDVFETEPPDPKHRLFQYNVIATPHVAGYTDASVSGIMRLLITNIKMYAAGQKPNFTVNAPAKLRKLQKASL